MWVSGAKNLPEMYINVNPVRNWTKLPNEIGTMILLIGSWTKAVFCKRTITSTTHIYLEWQRSSRNWIWITRNLKRVHHFKGQRRMTCAWKQLWHCALPQDTGQSHVQRPNYFTPLENEWWHICCETLEAPTIQIRVSDSAQVVLSQNCSNLWARSIASWRVRAA